MIPENLTPQAYATRFKQAIQQWNHYAVRSAWVITFVNSNEEDEHQLHCLEKTWNLLSQCVTEETLTQGSGKLLNDIKMAFFDPTAENDLLKSNKDLDESINSLNGDLRKHCYNTITKTLSQWELIIFKEAAKEKKIDHYAILYAGIKLESDLIKEITDYQEVLMARKNATLKMPWWNMDSIERDDQFLKRILALNATDKLSPSELRKAVKENPVNLNGYFNYMKGLYEKIENSLKKEMTQRARTHDNCPTIAIEDKQLLGEIETAFVEKEECAATPKLRSARMGIRTYHYDVYDNNFSSADNHQHSQSCGRKQKKEYYYHALGKEGDGRVKLSHLVKVRQNLCCFSWKMGSRNPWVNAHSTHLADRVEACLSNSLWKLSTTEINHDF